MCYRRQSLTPVAGIGGGRRTGRAGVIAAILGEQQVGGEFLVVDIAFAGMPVQPLRPPPPPGDDLYVALLSGVQLGNKHVTSPLPARLLVDWLSGELGSAQVRRPTYKPSEGVAAPERQLALRAASFLSCRITSWRRRWCTW